MAIHSWSKVVDVELSLAEAKDPEQWLKGRLLFVHGKACDSQQTLGKHEWAVFLTTDTALSGAQILELYAMRWAIEVYFKEAKQHMGFQKEQSNHFAAISLYLLVIAKQTQGADSIAGGGRPFAAIAPTSVFWANGGRFFVP
ncbi:MAG: transposase [Methylococcales bacterium]